MRLIARPRLGLIRTQAGLEQKQLAAMSGVTQPAICKIEMGAVSPKICTAWAIVKALRAVQPGISFHDVFPEPQR